MTPLRNPWTLGAARSSARSTEAPIVDVTRHRWTPGQPGPLLPLPRKEFR